MATSSYDALVSLTKDSGDASVIFIKTDVDTLANIIKNGVHPLTEFAAPINITRKKVDTLAKLIKKDIDAIANLTKNDTEASANLTKKDVDAKTSTIKERVDALTKITKKDVDFANLIKKEVDALANLTKNDVNVSIELNKKDAETHQPKASTSSSISEKKHLLQLLSTELRFMIYAELLQAKDLTILRVSKDLEREATSYIYDKIPFRMLVGFEGRPSAWAWIQLYWSRGWFFISIWAG